MYPHIFLGGIMTRLHFYNINDKYVEYLYQFDNKVPFNKNAKRPYIGVVLTINNIKYFAPLFSPKPQHKKYSDNPTYLRIGKDYGIIRFNLMIPVVESEINYLNFNNVEDVKYRNLLIAQNNFIQANTDLILKRANKLYNWVTYDKKDFFVSISCNFSLLEEKCKSYYIEK